ncbi:MAG: L-proline dehydrogenase [Gammaproteobacteria bacterium]|nr:L-proline dehydrogenase [Gammaproteobacteria bacterium]
MQDVNPPAFPPQWQPLLDRAANGLRQLALNEEPKARFCNDALLRPFMHRIARRYPLRTYLSAYARSMGADMPHRQSTSARAAAMRPGRTLRQRSFWH